MRYYRKNEHELIDNGASTIKVRHIGTFTRPASPGRVLKVFTVINQIRDSFENQVQPGAMLCLSFPSRKANAKEYTWHKQGREECQVNMNVQLHKRKGPILTDPATPVEDPQLVT